MAARKDICPSRRAILKLLGAIPAERAFAQSFRPAAPGSGELSAVEAPRVPHIDVHIHLIGGPQKNFVEAVKACVARMDEFEIVKAVPTLCSSMLQPIKGASIEICQ
jgi:hypothetical protein